MDTFASLPAHEREPYFQEAAARMGLPPHVIEKDFWVCWTLKRLSALETVAGHLLFKGGTSLSKVYGAIRRFSEGIDLSIHRRSPGFAGENDPANLTGKPRQRQDEALGEAARAKVQDDIRPELDAAIRNQLGDDGWSLDLDDTDPERQSLAFTYPSTGLTPDPTAYLKPSVKIEFGARAEHKPHDWKKIRPYLAETLTDALDEAEVEVKSISIIRAFWEKDTILHQQAHCDLEKPFPSRYSRHYCDLAAMIEAGFGDDTAQDEKLLADVVAHKIAFYYAKWASYETALRGTLCLVPPEERHPEIAADLDSMREMFFDDPPSIEGVMEPLRAWEEGFNRVE
jgi:hypothetical protein